MADLRGGKGALVTGLELPLLAGRLSFTHCHIHIILCLDLTVMVLFVLVSVLLCLMFYCVYVSAASCVLINM